MNKFANYKYCIVPCCSNSSVNASEKIFFSVPKDPVKRKAWIIAMKRSEILNKKLSDKSCLYCCEDHFSLAEDMENYYEWKLIKDVKRLRLKAGVIPHIFDCQKKSTQTPVDRPATRKRKQKHLVEERAGLKKTRKRNEGSVDSSDASMKEAKRSRKLNPLPKRSDKSFRAKYDAKGLDKETGADLCDCLIEDCPGCWMDCPLCGSRKCGPECRVFRRYKYDYVEIEGADTTIKNKNK